MRDRLIALLLRHPNRLTLSVLEFCRPYSFGQRLDNARTHWVAGGRDE